MHKLPDWSNQGLTLERLGVSCLFLKMTLDTKYTAFSLLLFFVIGYLQPSSWLNQEVRQSLHRLPKATRGRGEWTSSGDLRHLAGTL